MTPFEFSLVLSVVILSIYAGIGVLNRSSTQSYIRYALDDRRLNSDSVRNTFSGASISVSTVLLFFLALGIPFGYQILWAPITLAIGYIIFSKFFIEKIQADSFLKSALSGEADRDVTTFGEFIAYMYGSSVLGYICTVISGVGMICILIAEIMVGVQIFGQFFLKPDYIIILISLSLLAYAGFGGLKAIVETDKWQLFAIVIGLTLVLMVFFIPKSDMGEIAPPTPDFSAGWNPTIVIPAALVFNMLFVNISYLPSSLRVWQIVAATPNLASFKKGMWQSYFIVLYITIICLLISHAISSVYEGKQLGISEIFSYLTNHSTIVAYTVYPLLVISMLSALMSTADSAILPISQSIVRGLKLRWFQDLSLIITFIILISVIIFYFIVTKIIEIDLISWILTVFSITTSIAPAVIAPIFMKSIRRKRLASRIISIGVMSGFIAAVSWSIIFAGNLLMQPWNCVIGFLISGTSVFVAAVASNSDV